MQNSTDIENEIKTIICLLKMQDSDFANIDLSNRTNLSLALFETLVEEAPQGLFIANLNLMNAQLNDYYIKPLLELMKKTTISKLNLSHNQLGSDGISVLAAALQNDTALIEVNISYNLIDDCGYNSLIEGLKKNSTLQRLNGANNHIKKLNPALLTEMLYVNQRLFDANLSDIPIAEGEIKLLESTLQTINLPRMITVSRNGNPYILIGEIGTTRNTVADVAMADKVSLEKVPDGSIVSNKSHPTFFTNLDLYTTASKNRPVSLSDSSLESESDSISSKEEGNQQSCYKCSII